MGWVSPAVTHGSFGPIQMTVPCPLRQHVTQWKLTQKVEKEANGSRSSQHEKKP